ncbi:unnamed protein product [Sphagnum balticum]
MEPPLKAKEVDNPFEDYDDKSSSYAPSLMAVRGLKSKTGKDLKGLEFPLGKHSREVSPETAITRNTREDYRSIKHCIRTIFQNEGLKSFWKGSGIGLLRFYPNESINLQARKLARQHLPSHFASNICAAVAGGWAACLTLYPFDILRMTLSNTIEKDYSVLKTFKSTLKLHGARYFYKGIGSSLLTSAVFRGTFNGLYDTLKELTSTLEGKVGCAYISAVSAGAICYPLDSLRRRRIVRNCSKNVALFAREIVQTEGFKGFYKGARLILPQSVVGAVILLLFDAGSPLPATN